MKYHERRAGYEHLKTVIDTSLGQGCASRSEYGRTRDIVTYRRSYIPSQHDGSRLASRRAIAGSPCSGTGRRCRARCATAWPRMEDAEERRRLFRWLGDALDDGSNLTNRSRRRPRRGCAARPQRARPPARRGTRRAARQGVHPAAAQGVDRPQRRRRPRACRRAAAQPARCCRPPALPPAGANKTPRARAARQTLRRLLLGRRRGEMLALGALSRQSLLDEIVQNNPDAVAAAFGFYQNDALCRHSGRATKTMTSITQSCRGRCVGPGREAALGGSEGVFLPVRHTVSGLGPRRQPSAAALVPPPVKHAVPPPAGHRRVRCQYRVRQTAAETRRRPTESPPRTHVKPLISLRTISTWVLNQGMQT